MCLPVLADIDWLRKCTSLLVIKVSGGLWGGVSGRNTENTDSARLTWLGGSLLLICTGSPGAHDDRNLLIALVPFPKCRDCSCIPPWLAYVGPGCTVLTDLHPWPLYYTFSLHADVLPKPVTFWNSAVVSNSFLCIFIQFTGKNRSLELLRGHCMKESRP